MLSFPSLLFSDSFSHQPNKPFHIEKQKTKNSNNSKVVEREKMQNNNNNSKN